MKKILVGLMATLFLTFSFGTLSASVIDNGVLVASNDKCGGNGACGGDKKPIVEKKCGSEKKAENKCGGEKKPIVEKKCGSEKKSNDKCGAASKPVQKCESGKCAQGKCGSK